MTHDIGTRLHKALELYPDHETLRKFEQLPLYVLNIELRELFRTTAVQKSTHAMLKEGVGHLPFPDMAVELWGGEDYRLFSIFHEVEVGDYEVTVVHFGASGMIIPPDFLCELKFNPSSPDDDYTDDKGVVVQKGDPYWAIRYADSEKRNRKEITFHLIGALNLCLLMAHMDQLDKIEVSPTKLNKARTASGKKAIRDHIVVRIGHVYDRDGNRVRITDGNRRTMSIHARSGHSRRQHFGKGNENTKVIWIAPVLVNFKDGSPLPLPKPKVVKW